MAARERATGVNQLELVSRPYGQAGDWERLNKFVQKIVQSAANKNVNLHIGDLAWRFYRTLDFQPQKAIHFWNNSIDDEMLAIGWYSAAHHGLDLLIDPDFLDLEKRVLAWGNQRYRQFRAENRGYGQLKIQVFNWDQPRQQRLAQAGFRRDMFYYVWFEQSLNAPQAHAEPLSGFEIRRLQPNEAAERAELHNSAFFTDDVTQASYERLIQSPAYVNAIDLVSVAPDGRLAAFVLGWIDPVRKVGMLEPVGTHPEFRRLGLAKSLVKEMLNQMKLAGMQTAQVYTENPNIGAKRLYGSAGFRIVGKQYDWVKT
ncbi:MAG: GNAT family N-acetyltransferase [Chloroflexota bacterium]